jgi:tocopherol O-methyltransferase
MITPRVTPNSHAVARHYDDLDTFYRELWGEHLHHGIFETGREDPLEAAVRLVHLVAERGRVRPGDSVCDIGCGYGAPARLLAREYGAVVTGMTLSRAQYQYAVERHAGDPSVHLMLGDWLSNDLPPASFDHVISLEGSEHMEDLDRFFREASRVLRPGGRAVVCTWLACDDPSEGHIRYLLEPICREGRMVGLGTEAEYREGLKRADLGLERFDDLSARVRPTWTVSTRRLALSFFRRPDYRRFLWDRRQENRIFGLTVFRVWLAYRVGALRYGVFTAQKG